MSKEISDIIHFIKNKCHNSVLIDIIELLMQKKSYSIEISEIIAVFENLT